MHTQHLTRGLAAAVTATALAAGATLAGAPAASAAAPERAKNTSLAQVLAADGNNFDHSWGDFDILDAAVTTVLKEKPKSAVGVLAKGKVKLTAFIPNDRAFRNLAMRLTGTKPATEKATFNAVAKAAGVDLIETVLLYHVVPGKTLGSGKVAKADGVKLTTAQGGKVTVRVNKNGITLRDKDPDLLNPKVIATDINKGNPQIAHVINRVLLPADV